MIQSGHIRSMFVQSFLFHQRLCSSAGENVRLSHLIQGRNGGWDGKEEVGCRKTSKSVHSLLSVWALPSYVGKEVNYRCVGAEQRGTGSL